MSARPNHCRFRCRTIQAWWRTCLWRSPAYDDAMPSFAEWGPRPVDRERANGARIYDYLLGGSHNFADVLHADLRQPECVLGAEKTTRLLDLSRPVAVLMNASVHYVPDSAD